MYTGFTLPNPLAAPGTLDPSGSLAEALPLPPPGRPLDGSADLLPLLTVHIAALVHTYTILCAETITEGGEWTFTFTPGKSINGQFVGDAHRAVTLPITVGATHTPTGLGDQLVTAIANAKKITDPNAVGSATRLGEFIGTPANDSGTVTIPALIAGETWVLTYTAESGGSATVTNTIDAEGTNIRAGIFIAKTGSLAADGVTPLARLLESGDTAASIIGLVADGGTRLIAIDPESGYSFQYYRPGRDIPVIPVGQGHAQYSAYAEAAVDFGDDVWVRAIATGSEIAGAVNDTPDEAVSVNTVTPTAAAEGLVFQGFVQVYNRDGAVVATVPFYFEADADNTPTETVTGLKSDLTTPLASYVTVTGTATLVLTAVAGYTHNLVSTGEGILTSVYTGGTNDHVNLTSLYKSMKCSRTTTAAGSCAIQF